MMSRKAVYLGATLLSLLLGGCQESGDPEPAATDADESGIISSLPSISELAGTSAPEMPPLPILNPDDISLGREIYDIHCASYHGVNLEGEPNWHLQNDDQSFRAPPHDEDGHTWHHGDTVLVESIRLGGQRLPGNIGGTSPMPAFSEILSDEEITAVLTYIKSIWPDDIRIIQWESTVREP